MFNIIDELNKELDKEKPDIISVFKKIPKWLWVIFALFWILFDAGFNGAMNAKSDN